MKNSERLRFKKRLALNSLEAAICNVALFKSMKEKEFRDSIFISYNESGVILEALNEKQWNRANEYINNFIKNKRIELLTYGYDREVYQDLINHELKDYTKKLKDSEQDCPYVNLIHYQRLRKSCQFMDREKYVEPLKAWEKKNAHTPNFAYLVVQPRDRFEEVKRHILQMLRGDGVPIKTITLKPKQFLALFFNSQYTVKLKQMYQKKEVDLVAKNNSQTISSTIYGDIDFAIPQITVVQTNKKLFKLGFQIIKNQTIRKQISELKDSYGQVANLVNKMHEKYIAKHGPNYCFIVLNKDNKESIKAKIKQILSSQLQIQVIKDQICKHIACEYQDLKFIQDLHSTKAYQAKLMVVNDCQMMTHHYDLKDEELESFKIYLDQLGKYYNASLLRFYGICVKASNQYVVIMDYKPRSIQYMIDNCQFIDEIQVATIMLQLLYSINFLHTHDEPRFLGTLNSNDIYFPTCIVLPYLPDNLEDTYTFESDIKLVGDLFKELCMDPNEQIEQLIQQMTEPNSFKRIKMAQAIVKLQDIINT